VVTVAVDEDGDEIVDTVIEVTKDYFDARYVINPSNEVKIYWDLAIASLVVVSILVVPVNIAFATFALNNNAVETLNLVMFTADMVLSFRTCYAEKDLEDALVCEPCKIYTNYLKTWFVIDFLSTVPIDLIMQQTMGECGVCL
jgi:hypothetical protein